MAKVPDTSKLLISFKEVINLVERKKILCDGILVLVRLITVFNYLPCTFLLFLTVRYFFTLRAAFYGTRASFS